MNDEASSTRPLCSAAKRSGLSSHHAKSVRPSYLTLAPRDLKSRRRDAVFPRLVHLVLSPPMRPYLLFAARLSFSLLTDEAQVPPGRRVSIDARRPAGRSLCCRLFFIATCHRTKKKNAALYFFFQVIFVSFRFV